jgi:hypothetical protein
MITFEIDEKYFGVSKNYPLIEGGSEIFVN